MRFQPGQGGRPKGVRNKSTIELREVLARLGTDGKKDLHATRLHELSQSPDPHVAIKALAIVMAYRHGTPTQRLEVNGAWRPLFLLPAGTAVGMSPEESS